MIKVGAAFTSNFFDLQVAFQPVRDQFLVFEASVKIGRVQSAEFSDPGKLDEGSWLRPTGLLLEQDINEPKVKGATGP